MSLTNCRWISPESYSLVIPPLLSPIFQLTPRPPKNLSPPPAINKAFLKGGRRRGWEAEGAAVITINQTTDAHFFFSPPTQRTMMPPSQMLFTFHGTPTPPQNISRRDDNLDFPDTSREPAEKNPREIWIWKEETDRLTLLSRDIYPGPTSQAVTAGNQTTWAAEVEISISARRSEITIQA